MDASASSSGAAAKDPSRVELPALRTRTSTTYQNADGTRTAVVTLGSVNYPVGDSWLPIDTSLIPAVGRAGYAWQNGANSFSAFFKSLPTADYLRLETQGHVVVLNLEGASALASAAPSGSLLSYSQVFPGVDLRYAMLADGIKESLVLADSSAPATYRFRLAVREGAALHARQEGDGSWSFLTPSDTTVFSIAAPYAQDSAPGRTPAGRHATMTVAQAGAEFVIDLTLDSAWLKDPARKFPVVLDPTIQPPTLDGAFQNPCPAGQSCPDPARDYLTIGGDGIYSWWAALKFSNLGIPSSAYVTNATAQLRFLNGYCMELNDVHNRVCAAHNLDIYRMTGSWDRSTRTESLPYDGTALARFSLPGNALSQWMYWDIRGTAQGWIDGSIANNGLLVKKIPDYVTLSGPYVPASGYTGDQTLRPKLEITYNLPPNQPGLTMPAGGAALDTTTPALQASTSDPEGDPIESCFQVASDPGFTQLVDGSPSCPTIPPAPSPDWVYSASTTPNYTVPAGALKDGQTYYWRVRSRDNGSGLYQYSPWSATSSFNVRLRKLGLRDYWPIWSHGPLAVNEANGNLVISLPGPSYPYGTNTMSAALSYNSLAPTGSDQGLGQGWTLDTGAAANPPTKLIDHSQVPNGLDRFDAVERVSGDGSSDYYTHVAGSNTYLSAPGDGSQLTKNTDGSWMLLDSDGAIYSFNPADASGVAVLKSIEFVDANQGQTPLYHCYNGQKLTSIRTTTQSCPPVSSSPELRFKWASLEPALLHECASLCDGSGRRYLDLRWRPERKTDRSQRRDAKSHRDHLRRKWPAKSDQERKRPRSNPRESRL